MIKKIFQDDDVTQTPLEVILHGTVPVAASLGNKDVVPGENIIPDPGTEKRPQVTALEKAVPIIQQKESLKRSDDAPDPGNIVKLRKGEFEGRKGPSFSSSRDDQIRWTLSYKKETSILDEHFMLANLMHYLVPFRVDFPAPLTLKVREEYREMAGHFGKVTHDFYVHFATLSVMICPVLNLLLLL